MHIIVAHAVWACYEFCEITRGVHHVRAAAALTPHLMPFLCTKQHVKRVQIPFGVPREKGEAMHFWPLPLQHLASMRACAGVRALLYPH